MSRLLSTLAAIFFFASLGYSASLTIAAASDLTDLEPKLASSYRKTHPGTDIRWVTSASGVLTQQIENGAPYDLFMSANVQFIDRLSSNGKIEPRSITAYAVGQVAILWRDRKHHDLSDLRQNWVRIVALPNPQLAPYGTAAVESLQHEKVWEFVRQKVVYAENVRQALQLFESGNADAVLTAASLLVGRGAFVLPNSWHSPILQEAAIVTGTPNQAPAQSFLDFLKTPPARAIFAEYGFGQPQ